MDWNDFTEVFNKVGRDIFYKVIDELTEALCKTDLRSLITEDGAWNGFVKAAGLSSEEEAALRDALKECLARKPSGKNEGPQRKRQNERFLREFPQLKKKLEGHIRKLRELAAHFDQVHKDFTVSNVISSSVSAASGVLELSGLALAPFTAGASLTLSATSAVLGASSSVSSFVTSTVEKSRRWSDESEARRLVGASINLLEDFLKIIPDISFKFWKTIMKFFEYLNDLEDHIQAIRIVRSFSRIGAEAEKLTSTGRSSMQGVLQMTRGARIRAAGVSGVFLAWDVYDLMNQSKDLHDGGETESARALRDLAHKLEEKLQVFEKMYKALQSDPPQ